MFSSLGRLYVWTLRTLFLSLYNDMAGVRVVQAQIEPKKTAITRSASSETIIEAKKFVPSAFKLNLRYLPPFAIYSAYLLDTLVVYLESGSLDGTMGRKWLPALICQLADVFFLVIAILFWAITVQFLFHNLEYFETQFRMFAEVYKDGTLKLMRQGKIVYSKVEGENLFKLHVKTEKVCRLLVVAVLLFAYPFYNLNIVFNWSGQLVDLKATLTINLCLQYIAMHVYVAIASFVFNCRYLRLRQATQLSRLQRKITASNRILALKRAGTGNSRAEPSSELRRFLFLSWCHFGFINQHLNQLSRQISGFNGFWSRYLTVYFASLSFLVSYMAFILLKLDWALNPLTVAFIAYFAVVLLALLLYITLECSVLVVNNRETLKRQRILKVHTSLAGRIPLLAAIKFDHIEADSRSIERIGFKLLDSLQINSKMFEMLIVYISSIFMKIVQNEL